MLRYQHEQWPESPRTHPGAHAPRAATDKIKLGDGSQVNVYLDRGVRETGIDLVEAVGLFLSGDFGTFGLAADAPEISDDHLPLAAILDRRRRNRAAFEGRSQDSILGRFPGADGFRLESELGRPELVRRQVKPHSTVDVWRFKFDGLALPLLVCRSEQSNNFQAW
ncbi:MAG: hypothetical protein ACOYD1_13170 [Candidatus Nanopelagicales bacterium]